MASSQKSPLVKRLNDFLVNISSQVNGAVVAIDDIKEYLLRGWVFGIEENINMGIDATTYLLIDYTTYTNFSNNRKGLVYIRPPRMETTYGYVVVNVYRGTDYSGGSPALYSKRNTESDIEPQITMTIGATGSDKGTKVIEYLVGFGRTNRTSGGGSKEGITPFIRGTDDKTLVEIVNNSDKEIVFSYGQIFCEI